MSPTYSYVGCTPRSSQRAAVCTPYPSSTVKPLACTATRSALLTARPSCLGLRQSKFPNQANAAQPPASTLFESQPARASPCHNLHIKPGVTLSAYKSVTSSSAIYRKLQVVNQSSPQGPADSKRSTDDCAAFYINTDIRIQILDSMDHLPQAEKEQCDAFLRDERMLRLVGRILFPPPDFKEKLMKPS
ncbi:hypothetical protein C8J57DRAFT_1489975 [Mycena rebaudengoi]|nr:hypothetical protein C8J57DRAFT_1489975 [Mycena rebaudengoi]